MFADDRTFQDDRARRAHRLLAVTLFCCLGISGTTLPAQRLAVTIENTFEAGSFSLTPFWVAFHSGEFDVWTGGEMAGNFPGLEAIAEEGNTMPLSDAFSVSSSGSAAGVQATVTANTVAPPVFSPGETARYIMDVGDATVNRYFSYASMVIPSNDLFVATSVPTTHEIFDSGGIYQGPLTIEIFGRDVVDAGTEVNDIMGGAAFSAIGGEPTDEMSPLADIYATDPGAEYLQSIVGTATATGQTVESFFGPDDLVARITISVARAFRRGDTNSDARIDISDGIFLLGWMFRGTDAPRCLEAADINGDDALNLSDAMFVFSYLFTGTSAPPPPGPETCGQPQAFTFGCDRQDSCEDAIP